MHGDQNVTNETTTLGGMLSSTVMGSDIWSTSNATVALDGLISDTTAAVVKQMCTFLIVIISVFGMAANCTNIAVFFKEGFDSTSQLGLFWLSVADLGALTSTFCWTILANPLVALGYPVIRFVNLFISYFFFVENWMTLLITVERCIGVALPLKMKRIITYGRTKLGIVIIFIVFFLLHTHVMASIGIGWHFDPIRNATVFGVYLTELNSLSEKIGYMTTPVIRPVGMSCVLVVTLVMVFYLKRQARWRIKNNGDGDQILSTKEMQISKMVVAVASILIACTLPWMMIMAMLEYFIPGFKYGGRYHNTLVMFAYVHFLLGTVYLSNKIFVYYTMSTKYRITFHQIFGRCQPTNEND